MRHFRFGLIGAAVLLVLLPLVLGSCNISCACLTTPDPNWTPLPISPTEAANTAAKFDAGKGDFNVDDYATSSTYMVQGKTIFNVSKQRAVFEVVDAYGALVLEWVAISQLPNSADVSATADQVQATAITFVGDRGWDLDGLTAATTLKSVGLTSAYEVTWTDVTGTATGMSVWVNASTGDPFAFTYQRLEVQLAAPVIGATAAGKLAVALVSTSGEAVTSADFTFDLEHPTWTVHLAVPGAAGASSTHGADVSVNAATGAATADAGN